MSEENTIERQNLKMALIFRADLPEMTRAKSEIQACHAAVELTFQLTQECPQLISDYLAIDQPKINMEVDSLEALMAIAEKAKARGVPFTMIKDLGKTCFSEPTYTCILLGPMTKTNSNTLTKKAVMRDRERRILTK